MGIGGVSMSRRLIALLILTVTVLTACGRVQSTKPAAAGYLLFLEEGFTNGGQQITVRDSGTGKIQRQLPIGTAAPDWSRYYTVTPLSGSARLTAIDPGSGRTLAQTTIPAGYALPNFSYAGTSAGLSPNGQWLALTSQGKHADSGLVTNFLVGASSLSDPFLSLQVDGDFSFDALSNDGRSLYLIQKMIDPNHYQVRLYDISARSLVAQPVVDKREPNEPMEGIRGAALSADGRTLFAVGQTGLVAIDTATLRVRLRILSGETVDSIRLSADDKWLYAAGAANSNLWQIDPATGAVRGQVKGVTQPWALLWSQPTS